MRKYFSFNLLLISIVLNFLIPYFQKFRFDNIEEKINIGFPLRFMTIKQTLKGDSLFNSFDIDLGSLILSIIIIYIMLYLFSVLLPYKFKKELR